MKGITIEEAQDISTIKVYEMIGFLLTFVMTINEKLEKRNKSVAFKADVKDDHDQVEKDTDDNLNEFT